MRSGTLVLIAGLVAYPFAGSLVSLAAVMPLVPLGTALLFPSTTALMSRASDKSEVGVTMGIAQTYGGIARMIAPVIATFVYQRFGHTVPFYVAAAFVALVGILAFRVAQDPPEARF
jgi:MFS family permease